MKKSSAFIDKAYIKVKAGRGGRGCVSFHREKYRPLGGPDGGDGGKGGDIYIEVDENQNTLLYFRYRRLFQAKNGTSGGGNNRQGKDAPPLIIKVPPGTVISDAQTKEVIADLTQPGERVLVARGGKGGRGNARFASRINPAPRTFEEGEEGEEEELHLELKLIADVGMVGYPNAGKSTLLSRLSQARPKIADYPFTTLQPHLGVVRIDRWRTFTLADIPGLIKGAHQGKGLGDEFLRHIERTKLLLHIIDISGANGRDPYDDYLTIKEELKQYGILNYPQIVVANKMDLPGARDNLQRLQKKVKEKIFPISGLQGKGLEELVRAVDEKLKELQIDGQKKELAFSGKTSSN